MNNRGIVILCLLLPLCAAAAPPPANAGQGNTANQGRHYWMAIDVISYDSPTITQFASISPDTAKDLAVQALQEAAAQSSPQASDSLLHIDLSRHVRLALIGQPAAQTSRFGVTSVNVPLVSLRW